MHEGLCLFMGQVNKRVERAGAGVLVECSPAMVLGELLSEKWLASFVKCAKQPVVRGWGACV